MNSTPRPVFLYEHGQKKSPNHEDHFSIEEGSQNFGPHLGTGYVQPGPVLGEISEDMAAGLQTDAAPSLQVTGTSRTTHTQVHTQGQQGATSHRSTRRTRSGRSGHQAAAQGGGDRTTSRTNAKERNPDAHQRFLSFFEWPINLPHPRRMADANWFYTGPDDTVKCYECYNTMYDWEPNDDPLEEHRREYPDCAFVRSLGTQTSSA